MAEGVLNLDQPAIMGILNCTPDSFFGHSRVSSIDNLLIKAGEMIAEGALILDVGGYSTRPGAEIVPVQEEIERVIPAIIALRKSFPDITVSIDTYRTEVARVAIENGANWINDISGGTLDTQMYDLVAELNCPYVLTHIQGEPRTMQQQPVYKDVVSEIIQDLSAKLFQLRSKGVNDILVDPGIGFGKTIEDNYRIIAHLNEFLVLSTPLLIGISRKSFIYKKLGIQPEDSLAATSALHLECLNKGAKIIRVHDAGAARDIISIWKSLHA